MGYPRGCTELDKTEATQHVDGAGAFFFFGKEGVNSYLVILKLGLYVCETSENFRGEVWSGE